MKRMILHTLWIISLISLIVAGFMISGCSRRVPPDWYIVTGTGAADESLPPAQRRLMALKAAKEDARRQLLEAAKGVQITANTAVRDFIAQSDTIQSRVMGVIAGAQIIGEPRYMDDGTVEVDMRLDMNRVRYSVK